MADDPPRPKRFQTNADRDLEAARRRRTPPGGVDALPDPIDDDMTPPPARIGDLENMGRDQAISELRAAAAANAKAIEHEVRIRHEAKEEGRELGAINEKLAVLATAVNNLDGVEQLVREILVPGQENVGEKLDKLLVGLEVTRQHTQDLDRQMERLFQQVGGLGVRIGAIETSVIVFGQRLDAMGANFGDKQRSLEAKVAELEATVTKLRTQAKVEKALTRREKVELAGGAGGFGAVIAWVVHHLLG